MFVIRNRFTQLLYKFLEFLRPISKLRQENRNVLLVVGEKDVCKFGFECINAQVVWIHILVHFVGREKLFFSFNGILNSLALINVQLTSTIDSNIAKFEWNLHSS